MYAQKIVLKFPSNLVDKPIVYRLTKDFNLEFNVLKAMVNPKEEGVMVLELKGEKQEFDKALAYLKKENVKVQTLSKDVTRDDDKCIHCGLCVGVCPVAALVVDEASRDVLFYDDKCIACGMCVKVCPYGAMELTLGE